MAIEFIRKEGTIRKVRMVSPANMHIKSEKVLPGVFTQKIKYKLNLYGPVSPEIWQ